MEYEVVEAAEDPEDVGVEGLEVGEAGEVVVDFRIFVGLLLSYR